VAGGLAVRGGDLAVKRGGLRGVRGMQARDHGGDAGTDRRRGHPARAAELGGVLLTLDEQGVCGGGAGRGRTDRRGAADGGGRRGGGTEGPRMRERGGAACGSRLVGRARSPGRRHGHRRGLRLRVRASREEWPASPD
jgi:hypothetical protein